MTTAQLLVRYEGPVQVLTISNPALRNAMHPSLYRSGAAAVREATADPAVRAIVITGDGEHFCGGGDLHRLRQQRDLPPQEQMAHLDALRDWVLALQAAPQPVIAAVEGAAAGAGFSLCLGCDLIVAAEDASFVMSYARVGLTPDGGGSDSLARALPPQAALELLLEGGKCNAQRLYGWGVVNKVVPHGGAFAAAMEWATRLARGFADAQSDIKRLVYAARGRDRLAQLDAERDAFVKNLYGEDAGRAIAAFLDRSQ
jgi:enoyl-CoA hydratase/carnithine racemase